jgi:hypothetical protein
MRNNDSLENEKILDFFCFLFFTPYSLQIMFIVKCIFESMIYHGFRLQYIGTAFFGYSLMQVVLANDYQVSYSFLFIYHLLFCAFLSFLYWKYRRRASKKKYFLLALFFPSFVDLVVSLALFVSSLE